MLRYPSLHYTSFSKPENEQYEQPQKRPFLKRRSGLINLLHRIESNQALVRSSSLSSSDMQSNLDYYNRSNSFNRGDLYQYSRRSKVNSFNIPQRNSYQTHSLKYNQSMNIEHFSNSFPNSTSIFNHKKSEIYKPNIDFIDQTFSHPKENQSNISYIDNTSNTFSNPLDGIGGEAFFENSEFNNPYKGNLSRYRLNNNSHRYDGLNSYLKLNKRLSKIGITEKGIYKKRPSILQMLKGSNEKNKSFYTKVSNPNKYKNFCNTENFSKNTLSSTNNNSLEFNNEQLQYFEPNYNSLNTFQESNTNSLSPNTTASSNNSSNAQLKTDFDQNKDNINLHYDVLKQSSQFINSPIEQQGKRRVVPLIISFFLFIIIIRIALNIYDRSIDKDI